MKRNTIIRCLTVLGLSVFTLFNAATTKAQNDIINNCTIDIYDCTQPATLEIPFNFDGTGIDSSVVIQNISGFRYLDTSWPNKQYKFCAANNFTPCSTPLTDNGRFQIRFKYNGSFIAVKKVNLIIHNTTIVTITVTAYQGTTPTSIPGDPVPGGIKYVYEHSTIPYDYIEVITDYDAGINPLTQAFDLDELHIPSASANQTPTDITLSSNNVNENAGLYTAIGTLTTADPDAGDIHTYTLVSGAGDSDNSSFRITGNTLESNAVFNYETRSSYSIRLQTDDGNGGTFSKEFIININDVIEISSFSIVPIADASVTENSDYTSITPSISGTPIGTVTYSLGGTDAGSFNINPLSGVATMVPRNFEDPSDANINNVYELSIIATDADGNSDSESWTVTVNDVIEISPITINPVSDISINENTIYTSVTPTLGGIPIGSVSYTLGGTDAGDFSINSVNGVVTMVSRDFENPVDADTNNEYEISVTVTDDDGNTDSEDWKVLILNITESATFNINPIPNNSINENMLYSGPLPSITGSPSGPLTYTLEGNDAGDFTINSSNGLVSMVARDYEIPVDANTNNVYELTIKATDSDGNSNSEAWTVTVIDVIEITVFNIDEIPDININENLEYTSILPHITGTIIGSVTYILEGVDAGLFGINPANGIVSMIAQDFENPVDSNHDNVYQVSIRATDEDGNYDSESWSVSVNNVPSDGPPEVVCLFDLSYSMNRDFYDNYTANPNEAKLTHSKSALIAFADLLYSFNHDASSLGLARFPNSPQVGCDAGNVKLLRTLDLAYNTELATDIPGLIANGGSTPLLAGIDFAINMFNSDNKKVIVLLSDGRQNCPTASVTSSMTSSAINALNTEGIILYTIGFGDNTIVPNDMLNTLASGTNNGSTVGAHYNVSAVSDKSPVYDPAAPDTWNPVTALHATYASIFVNGLGLNPCTDPLGIINQGTIKEFDIPVTVFDEKVCFFVSWATPQVDYLNVKLYMPSGNEISMNQTGIISMHRTNHTIITLSREILNLPGMTGTWKLKIDGSQVANEYEHYQYSVLNLSKKLNLHTWFEKEKYYAGDKMRIFLELINEGERINGLGNVFIKGTSPGESLGKWLTGKKVNEELLSRARQKQFDEYLKWAMEQPEYSKLSAEAKQNYQNTQKESFLKNIDPIQLRAQVLKDEFKMRYPKRVIIDGLQFNDEGINEDKKAGDGLYTAVHTPIKEGSYQFYISVNDSGRLNPMHRENQLQKYVNVKPLLKSFVRKVKILEITHNKETICNITLKLKDKYGNIPSQSDINNLKLSVDKGVLTGGITDNLDGTFTQKIILPADIKPRNVTITMTIDGESGKQKLASIKLSLLTVVGIIVLMVTGFLRRKRK